MYLYIEFKGGGFLCSDHASEEDWASFAGRPVVRVEWRSRRGDVRIDLIVTRHPGLVEYLRELGLAGEGVQVVSHATPENVAGKHVCGVLPHNLSCLCTSFTEVPLNLPAEMRGKELTLEEVRRYAGAPVTYRVEVIHE